MKTSQKSKKLKTSKIFKKQGLDEEQNVKVGQNQR